MKYIMHWREKDIIDALGEGKLKTSDIIGRVNMCKVTALKYLYRLMRRGIVDYEKIGPTKLWYVSRSNPDGEREKSGGRILNLDRLYGEKAKIVFTSNGITLTMEGKIVNRRCNEQPSNMVG